MRQQEQQEQQEQQRHPETAETAETGSGGILEVPDFRVGDEVYCLSSGKGVIVQINKLPDNDYPIRIKFNHDGYDEYTIFGQLYTDNDNEGPAPRCLFHEKGFKHEVFEIVPKRSKKVWVNLYSCSPSSPKKIIGRYYLTRQEADLQASPKRLACVEIEIPEEKK